MFDKRELSKDELEAELAVELPEREAMGGINISINVAPVIQVANATAVAVLGGNAWAWAANLAGLSQFA